MEMYHLQVDEPFIIEMKSSSEIQIRELSGKNQRKIRKFHSKDRNREFSERIPLLIRKNLLSTRESYSQDFKWCLSCRSKGMALVEAEKGFTSAPS
ncbi:hypothetical protein HZC92_23435 [Klebsiella pneumoniae]|uniref:hypothetical protein n=1 Tax=Klebsiella pneumoniae TaxID=573 RepID=UPI001EFCDF75|nr:hypothetical protein [Klebsiella pneumoniae]MCG8978619.1 hypothetical protein [Klebsiella pneumoniae]